MPPGLSSGGVDIGTAGFELPMQRLGAGHLLIAGRVLRNQRVIASVKMPLSAISPHDVVGDPCHHYKAQASGIKRKALVEI